MSTLEFWEILVPTTRPDGRPIKVRYHKVWDKMINGIAGGCTVLKPTKGKWVAPDGAIFEERMIPIRIGCTKEQIDIIIDLTLEYYDQKAVIAYRISNEVILRHRSSHGKERIDQKIGAANKAVERTDRLDCTDGLAQHQQRDEGISQG